MRTSTRLAADISTKFRTELDKAIAAASALIGGEPFTSLLAEEKLHISVSKELYLRVADIDPLKEAVKTVAQASTL
jgi:hypothetical protein